MTGAIITEFFPFVIWHPPHLQQHASELFFQKYISLKAAGNSADSSMDFTFSLDLRVPAS